MIFWGLHRGPPLFRNYHIGKDHMYDAWFFIGHRRYIKDAHGIRDGSLLIGKDNARTKEVNVIIDPEAWKVMARAPLFQ